MAILTAPAFASDPELATLQIDNRKYLGISNFFGRWPGAIPWVYNPTGAPAALSDDNEAIELISRSMTLWSNVSGITFDFQGIDSQAVIGDVSDGVVTVGWDDTIGFAGLAGPSTTTTQQTITELGYAPFDDGSVRLNPTAFNGLGSSNAADRRNAVINFLQIVGHEIGHLIGFGHSDEPVSILYANPYNFIPFLTDDDVSGAQAVYGMPDSFTPPDVYQPPALVNSNAISNVRVINQSGTDITEVTDADQGLFFFVRLDADANLTDELYVVATDPSGRIVSESSFDDGACNAVICIRTTSSLGSQLTARYLPGTWQLHVILAGQRVATVNLDLNTSIETINSPPDGVMTINKVSGQAPLSVTVGANVTGDAEGDNASVNFHLPSEGTNSVDLGGPTGSAERTITLTNPGTYDLYVELDDDSVRYDNSQAGFDDAGLGFRRLFRRQVTVYERSPILVDVGGQINLNQSNELGSLIPPNAGPFRLQVNDTQSGNLVKRTNYLTDEWDVRQVLSIPGISPSGTAFAVFAVRIADNLPIGQIKDGASGAFVGNLFALSGNWNFVKATTVPNVAAALGEGATPKMDQVGVAVLAARSGDQLMIVQLRDPKDDSLIRNINPLGFGWTAKDMVTLDVNGTPAVGVLATRNGDGLVIIQVRDASNGSLIKNVFPLGLGWSAQELKAIPDLDGNGVQEIAVRMTRDIDGLEIIQVRDSLTNNLISNVYPIGAGAGGWSTQSFDWMDNAGTDALAILSTRDSDGQILVQQRRLDNAGVIRNIFYLGPPWVAGAGFSVLPDFNGNGVSEIAVAADNSNNGSRLIQVRDGSAGNVIRNISTVP